MIDEPSSPDTSGPPGKRIVDSGGPQVQVLDETSESADEGAEVGGGASGRKAKGKGKGTARQKSTGMRTKSKHVVLKLGGKRRRGGDDDSDTPEPGPKKKRGANGRFS